MPMDSSVAYKRALQEMTVYDFVQVDVPLFSRQDDAMGSLDDIPLKDLEGKYLAKIVVDLVQDVPLDSVNFSQLEEGMLQKQYDGLPPPFGPKVTVSMPYKLQIAIIKTSLTHCAVLKYFCFDQKVNTRLVNDMAYGTLKLIDFTPNFRAGPLAIQLIFFCIRTKRFKTERRLCSTLALQESATLHFRHPLRGNMTETEKNVLHRIHNMSNLRNLTKNRIQDNNIGKNIDHASPCRKTHDEIPKTRKKPSIEILESLGSVQPNQVIFIRKMSRDKEYRSDPRYLRSECISP